MTHVAPRADRLTVTVELVMGTPWRATQKMTRAGTSISARLKRGRVRPGTAQLWWSASTGVSRSVAPLGWPHCRGPAPAGVPALAYRVHPLLVPGPWLWYFIEILVGFSKKGLTRRPLRPGTDTTDDQDLSYTTSGDALLQLAGRSGRGAAKRSSSANNRATSTASRRPLRLPQ